MPPRIDHDTEAQTSRIGRYQDALLLWLKWNEAHQRMTGALYASRRDPQQIEQLMDRLDQLRAEAVRLSQELLDSAGQ
jgi:hypothetical protein